ncbi:MAG: ATP-binding protein [Anaeromyxobacter sp.]
MVGPDRLALEVDRLLENILEREEADAALRASERRLELVLEGAQAAYWDWDIPADSITLDERWGALVGLPTGDGQRTAAAWRGRIHPDDRTQAVAAVQAHLGGRSSAYVAEYRVRFADGSWHWVAARSRVVTRDAAGRPVRMAGTWTDVTERRALQDRLELSSRLASVGTLAAGVAHEINNPLTFVDANLRWALEQLEGGAPASPEALRGALRDALDGAVRVREIVQTMRRLARPIAGGRGTADVSAEISQAADIARRQVEARARLRLDVGSELPAVRVSRHELGQVLVNLLVNAAQALPEGHATEHEVRVTARREGEGLLLEVADTGPGIPPEVLPHVFDPFFTTKQVDAGTGLGLAICHRIVEAGGGTITVTSEPGCGATFRIRLPAAPAPASPAEAADRGQPARAPLRRRVLVIDDEPLVGRAVARALGAEHEVLALTSAREALRRLQAGERWDLVLCDMLMPELTGPQLARLLEEAAPEVLPRLVFMTGASSLGAGPAPADERRCLEKPLDVAALRALVAGA